MATVHARAHDTFDAWNPGIESQIPQRLRPLCTIFRPENALTDFAKAEELRDLTGLPLSELVAFRPERLALHELLIRVTADFSVPDGFAIGDLGINFRQMVNVIHSNYLAPRMDAIVARYEEIRRTTSAIVEAELAACLSEPAMPPAPKPSKSRFMELFRWSRSATERVDTGGALHAQRSIPSWEAASHATADEQRAAAHAAVSKVVSALEIQHGGMWGSRSIAASLATDIACNRYGGDEIGRLIEPWLQRAVSEKSYRLLPRQAHPLVMNTKGPSASGKSTLRPLQKRLAGDIGVDWSDFALISPDIWRKQLLEYESLGDIYKYGGAFTGDELQIVDHKLDRYMARKAQRGDISHLLIDRFRFDSFAPDSHEAGSNLLTRFGHTVYLFFLITPPDSLVERAWARGLEFGRYKAVDDTLAHGIEAYSGMPELFFTWSQRADKHVHFEFLDNSVALGERPRTLAFGWNDELNVLDIKCILDVERYRRVNVDAERPDLLFSDPAQLAPEENTAFLRECVERFRRINFADQATGQIYLRVESGAVTAVDRDALQRALANADMRAGLLAVAPAVVTGGQVAGCGVPNPPMLSGDERKHTLGAWGRALDDQ